MATIINSFMFPAGDSDFSSWFLPSTGELNAMYVNLKAEGVGDFANARYWSSTEYSNIGGYGQDFYNGSQGAYIKSATNNVRATRTFTAAKGAYSLRETGPGGGLIFYIDDTTYYEAAASDQSASQVWSNIDDEEIGVSAKGTAIGTGLDNTTAIIAQYGHSTSAAKVCDDYTI